MSVAEETKRHTLTVGDRTIEYFHLPAKLSTAPVLFILHGHDFSAAPASFRSESHHVVCPMDRFGVKNGGSWWLGEDGIFFWIEAISKIVEDFRSRGAGDIYFWGSSMGGYGALLHGYLNSAKAVYANVPQTLLLGSSYSNEGGMRKYFEKIFAGCDSEFNDLRKVITEQRSKYFLCFNQLERHSYFKEQGLDFISHLNDVGASFYLEVRPLEAHGKNHGIRESLDLFEMYC